MKRVVFLVAIFAWVTAARPDEVRGLNALPEVALAQLTDRNISPLGQSALAIKPADWKHAETANFVYHFFQGFIATPVSVEAEFYYRVVAKELEKDTTQWERKSHICVFERAEDWKAFQQKASLDPWTGGIHSGNDLFLLRDAEYKFKGRTLGHEITHLVLHRFFGSGIPLWLNEGYAEYASIRAYASFERARGFRAKPQSQAIPPADFVPLDKLANALAYPTGDKQVATFYAESEKLVRFLSATDRRGFLAFLDAMSKGNRFDTALARSFGARFSGVDSLEREFKTYATKDYASD